MTRSKRGTGRLQTEVDMSTKARKSWGRRMRGAAALAPSVWLAAGLWSGAAGAGSLLDPTPQDAMRPLSTDRPDVTESPYTVDAGHVQVEADVVSFSRKRYDAETHLDELRLAQFNVKVGLHDRVDLQFVIAPYVKQTFSDGSPVTAESVGSDDLTIRLKVNLLGNDGGPFAITLLPFVAPPTASSIVPAREPAWGIAVPAAFSFPNGVGLGSMVQFTAAEEDRLYLLTASVSRAMAFGFAGFVEFAAERVMFGEDVFGRENHWNTTLDAGLTLGVTPDLQLDGAVLIGLTDEATDWTVYTGLTVRR